MPTREELEAMVRRKRLEDAVREKRAREQETVPVVRRATEALGSAIQPVVEGAGQVSSFIDKYTGAPIRAGIGALQEGKSLWEAYKTNVEQFGEDPSKAPSWTDIAAKTGLTTTGGLKTGFKTGIRPEDELVISPAEIGGAALGAITDPTMYMQAPVKAGIAGAEMLAKGASKAIPKAYETTAKIGGKLTGNLPGEAIETYIRTPEKIKGAKSLEDLKSGIDKAVSDVLDPVEQLKKDVISGKADLKDLYKTKIRGMEREVTPLAESRSIKTAIEGEKQILGSLSKQADDALERSGVTFQKKDLLDAVDKAGKDLGKIMIGDQQKEAVSKLLSLKNDIAGLPDVLSAPEIREVMNQIRKDIDYQLAAGEFNDTTNKTLKVITKQMSDALKKASPEYAAYMNRMSDLATNLTEMNQYFGKDIKALASMEAIRKGKSSTTQLIEDILTKYAEASGRKDIIRKIEEMKTKRDLLQRMKDKDITQEIFPKEYSSLQEKINDLEMAEKTLKPIKGITPQKSQGIIERMGRREQPNIEELKALENLQTATGENFLDDIKYAGQKKALDAGEFSRGFRQAGYGSVGGAAIGSALGLDPITSGAVAGGLGFISDRYAGKLMKAGIDMSRPAVQAATKSFDWVARNVGQLGKYEQPIKAALERGGKSALLLHHVLLQSDPEYEKFINNQMGETP